MSVQSTRITRGSYPTPLLIQYRYDVDGEERYFECATFERLAIVMSEVAQDFLRGKHKFHPSECHIWTTYVGPCFKQLFVFSLQLLGRGGNLIYFSYGESDCNYALRCANIESKEFITEITSPDKYLLSFLEDTIWSYFTMVRTIKYSFFVFDHSNKAVEIWFHMCPQYEFTPEEFAVYIQICPFEWYWDRRMHRYLTNEIADCCFGGVRDFVSSILVQYLVK